MGSVPRFPVGGELRRPPHCHIRGHFTSSWYTSPEQVQPRGGSNQTIGQVSETTACLK